jgi:hypothetical protein
MASANSAPLSTAAPAPKLLDQVRASLRVAHYANRTEQSYIDWIKRFILFHGKRRRLDRLPRGCSRRRCSHVLNKPGVRCQVTVGREPWGLELQSLK